MTLDCHAQSPKSLDSRVRGNDDCDPQASSELYSNYVNRALFDPLYKYDTFDPHPWMYLDLDVAERRSATK